MMKKEYIMLKRSIWPDVDGPEGVNQFLKGLGIEVSFLLDSGIKFSYSPERLEPYKIGEGTLFFKDSVTKENLLHYYEGLEELVFENMITKETYKIPIYDDWTEIRVAGD
jgi:hypothetical protein